MSSFIPVQGFLHKHYFVYVTPGIRPLCPVSALLRAYASVAVVLGYEMDALGLQETHNRGEEWQHSYGPNRIDMISEPTILECFSIGIGSRTPMESIETYDLVATMARAKNEAATMKRLNGFIFLFRVN